MNSVDFGEKRVVLPKHYSVLLIESDPKETDVYTDLVKEVAECKIDVMSWVDSSFDWIAKSDYHLVVIDMSAMFAAGRSKKTLDGLSFLERIKQLNPGTSVILVSEHATVKEAVAAVKLGAEDYFKKPFEFESFKLAVKRGLDKKTVFGEHAQGSEFLNLVNACQMVSASLDRKKIFSIMKSYFAQELGSLYSVLYRIKDEEIHRMEDGSEESGDQAMEEVLDIAVHAAAPFKAMIDNEEDFRFIQRGKLTPGLFVFRFRCVTKEELFYVCLSPKTPRLLEAFENRLKIFNRQIDVTGKNIKQYIGVQNLVFRDDATGLYNTRYLDHLLDREIKLADSTKQSFAVLFIDADRFKGVNDQHGHLIGTRLLNELGHHLKKLVRDSDTVFRYGGDEFVAVLSQCDLETAKMVAGRIRESVEAKSFLGREKLNLKFTVSIGVALYPQHAKSKKAIVDAADQAMYVAKKKSRNFVYIISPDDLKSKKEKKKA